MTVIRGKIRQQIIGCSGNSVNIVGISTSEKVSFQIVKHVFIANAMDIPQLIVITKWHLLNAENDIIQTQPGEYSAVTIRYVKHNEAKRVSKIKNKKR